MKISELSRRTGVPARMLRYYEEQDLLHPDRTGNGYRWYAQEAVYRVQQIRGLLDSGLTTEADRLQQRIDCLRRNRDAIRAYLAAIESGLAACGSQ